MKLTLSGLPSKIKKIFKTARPKKLFLFFGRHAFLFFLIIIVAELIYGALLAYNYVFLAENQPPQTVNTSFNFKENIYQEILEEWATRETKFQQSSDQTYKSPF